MHQRIAARYKSPYAPWRSKSSSEFFDGDLELPILNYVCYEMDGNEAVLMEESIMPNRRNFLYLLAAGSTLSLSGTSFAKGPHRHHNGHDLLGEKLKKNGKHAVGKAGNESVIAEVADGKVVSMSAGSLPVSKVKTNKKMADAGTGNFHLAAFGETQMAQVVEVYYGYCFDSGQYVDCYWYPASDVIVTDVWVEYVPV